MALTKSYKELSSEDSKQITGGVIPLGCFFTYVLKIKKISF